jgi:uncharacterized Zn finger protein
MAAIPALSESTIRTHSSSESFSRGQSYYRKGAVSGLMLRGNELQAEVEGSEYAPYRVRITFDQGGVTAATCSCPYDWGGWCKHIVAALLASLRSEGPIAARPPLEALLADLDRAQLQALLLGLAERDPDLADTIDRQIGLLRLANAAPQSRSAGTPARRSPIDQAAIRQQVQFAMRPQRRGRYGDYDDYDYDDEDPGGEVVEAVRPLLERAREFVSGGDARSALAILDALSAEYLAGCRALSEQLDDMYGLSIDETSAGEFLGDLGEAWAEAILSADLLDDERDQWGERIAELRDEAADLDIGQKLDIALTAAEHGWDYPPLKRVFAGEITELGAWDGPAPEFSDELALIRLRILERQGRTQEYLHLAEAEGQTELYLLMLARLGRTAEAVAEGLQYLTTPNDALALAKALREQGDLAGAWQIAQHGLALPPPRLEHGYTGYFTEAHKAELADWAVELAVGMAQPEQALRAAETAFRIAPSLPSYLRAQDLAGVQWDELRPRLLDILRRSGQAAAKVDVFLHEGLIDDAIAAVDGSSDYRLLERVMDVAAAARPGWVIAAATDQAERIMRAGDAQRYEQAVGWLRRARDAFRADGRPADWQGYLEGVRAQHGRKYKLMGLIERM